MRKSDQKNDRSTPVKKLTFDQQPQQPTQPKQQAERPFLVRLAFHHSKRTEHLASSLAVDSLQRNSASALSGAFCEQERRYECDQPTSSGTLTGGWTTRGRQDGACRRHLMDSPVVTQHTGEKTKFRNAAQALKRDLFIFSFCVAVMESRIRACWVPRDGRREWLRCSCGHMVACDVVSAPHSVADAP